MKRRKAEGSASGAVSPAKSSCPASSSLEQLEILAPEDHGERPHRKEEPALGGHPPSLGAEPAAADQTVDMQMLAEVLAPAMEDHGDADLTPEPVRITAEGLQGVRGRLKQETVDPLRISLDQRVDRVRQGEDQMDRAPAGARPCVPRPSAPWPASGTSGNGGYGRSDKGDRTAAVTGLQVAPEAAVRQSSIARMARGCGAPSRCARR